MFKDEGFEVLYKFVETRPLELALAALQTAGLTGRSINYTGPQVNSIHGLQSEFFEEMLHSDKLMTMARYYLGEQALPRAAELFAKPATVGLPSPWHQDNAYWCLEPANGLTFWIALDEADAENGGVTYLRGSHRGGLYPHEPSYAKGSSQTLIKLPRRDHVTPALNPGDALVHHCLTIHGSAANRSGRPRRGLTLQYQGVSAQTNHVRLKAYEEALAAQVQGRA